MEKIKSNFIKYKQFIIYSIIGGCGATLDILIYAFLSESLSMDKVLANTISTSVGIINSFFLNVFFNFKSKNKLVKRFISFYIVGLSGLLLSNLIIFIFVDNLGWNNLGVKLFTLILVVILQYNLNKRVSFKKE